jgi:hypothetical protein
MAWLDGISSLTSSVELKSAGRGDRQATPEALAGERPIAHAQRQERPRARPVAAQHSPPICPHAGEDAAAHMEDMRREHEQHLEEERVAEREKEKQRKARTKAERDQRIRVAAERAQAGSSSAPSSTPAPGHRGCLLRARTMQRLARAVRRRRVHRSSRRRSIWRASASRRRNAFRRSCAGWRCSGWQS